MEREARKKKHSKKNQRTDAMNGLRPSSPASTKNLNSSQTQTTSALKNTSTSYPSDITASSSAPGQLSTTTTTAGVSSSSSASPLPEINTNDICSPHELIGWVRLSSFYRFSKSHFLSFLLKSLSPSLWFQVDDVLEKLESKFSRIESDVIERRKFFCPHLPNKENPQPPPKKKKME
jgi:hypothetical protein